MPLKNLLLYLFLPLGLAAQETPLTTIALIDRLPLIAETGVFAEKMHANNQLHVLSSYIRIAIAPRSMNMVTDYTYQLNKPLPETAATQLQYRIQKNGLLIQNWQPIAWQPYALLSFPYAGKLLDMQLATGDTLRLELKVKGGAKAVQQLTIYRTAMQPQLQFYRNKKHSDVQDTRIAASMSSRFKRLKQSFDSLISSHIVVGAGHELQCLLKPAAINRDSCLQYRIRTVGDTAAQWRHTGHLLSIPFLTANTRYQLDIRYAGNAAHSSYTIEVKPYWHQTEKALLLFTALLLVLLLLGYRYRSYRQNKARRQLLEQLNQLQVKLNPHFVYNALGSIEGLVQQQEPEKLNRYLTAFSGILRSSLLNGNNLLIPLRQDMDLLGKYLFIEQLRHGFQFSITVANDLPVAETEFPPMLLQPVVENAIQHGVAAMRTAGTIQIHYYRKEQHLCIRVSDNGTGTSMRKGTGLGKQLTMERIERLSRFLKQGTIACTIEHHALGTDAHFIFENWLSH